MKCYYSRKEQHIASNLVIVGVECSLVGTITTRTRCGTSTFQAHSKRPHPSKSPAASLATSTLAHRV